MGQFPGFLSGLVKSLYAGKKKAAADGGREAADSMARAARKNGTILRSSGSMEVEGSGSFVSAFSRRGEKGVNQDCSIVWKGFGCQEDLIFCGIFDGHGLWGREVAKMVRESLPTSLLCSWQETLVLNDHLALELDPAGGKKVSLVDIWKQCYLSTCAAIDMEIKQHRGLDPFYSGSTALTVVMQGELIVLANVGDSRAVLATAGGGGGDDDGGPIPVQLTMDFKPGLPQEAERIRRCNGRVFCLEDEPGVARVWLPCGEVPGLAMSRAFGDFCVKDFGLISTPEVTHRRITDRDLFLVLATDGVWDVVSNLEAVQIVSSTPDRAKAAKRLVEHAAAAWRRCRRGIAADDCSAVCLFFHPAPP